MQYVSITIYDDCILYVVLYCICMYDRIIYVVLYTNSCVQMFVLFCEHSVHMFLLREE